MIYFDKLNKYNFQNFAEKFIENLIVRTEIFVQL